MEFRRSVLLTIILIILFITPSLMWYRLTPAVYEDKLELVTPITYEHASKVVKNPRIDSKYEERETMIVKKEKTWFPFVTKTTDTIYTTGKRIWRKDAN
jgi:hypothetical protein